MKFDLIRPCPKCPFRTDIPGYLRPARARAIGNDLLSGATFTCHETTVPCHDDSWEREDGPNAQHCAGALLFLELQNRPNQFMRIFERLGGYDRNRLDYRAPVARSLKALIAQHNTRRKVSTP